MRRDNDFFVLVFWASEYVVGPAQNVLAWIEFEVEYEIVAICCRKRIIIVRISI